MHTFYAQLVAKIRSCAPSTGSACAFALMIIGCVYSDAVFADLYSCKDEAGRVISSDRPLPECGNRSIRILRSDGVQKGEIAAPLTAEQKIQKEIVDQKKKAQENAQREQNQSDRALVAAFPSLQALEASRKRQVAEITQEISSAKKRIELKYPDLEAANAELEFYKKKPVPNVVKSKIQTAALSILVEDELIATKNSELAQLNKKYDSDGKRLRELSDPVTGKLAQAPKH